LGAYALVGRLGAGGQGVVYLGADSSGRQVAVKLMHAQLIEDSAARGRFVRELAALQRVAGFCTAQVLDADMAGAQPYIVSEYVPGRSLQDLVVGEGPRTGADLERLAIGTVTALTAIHQAGIVHRDFKPPNVLMGQDGPRVIDFGIALALDNSGTMTSQIVGTPAYMAPEQLVETGIGPPADLFAWGATMLYAATGHSPFEAGAYAAVVYRIMNVDPDLSALGGQLANVVGHCLAKDPVDRPGAQEVLLQLIGQTAPLASHPATVPVPPPQHFPTSAPSRESVPVLAPPPPQVPEHLLAPGPTRTFQPPPSAPVPATRSLGRSPAVVTGLTLAVLLSILDLVALGPTAFDPLPRLGAAKASSSLLANAAFAGLGAATLVAAIGAWRGSRTAVWAIIALRAVRCGLWFAWISSGVRVQGNAIALHTVVPAIVIALLCWGLWRTRRT
jgi:serine/threonine protein kinase